MSIDLKNPQEQRQEFGNRLKGPLNKSRRLCTVKKAINDREYQDFILIYHKNMDRVKAKRRYYSDQNYFEVLAKSKSFNTKTLLAIDNVSGETVGASMFIHKNSVVHYHLSGAREDSLHLMPVKLLIDEMRIKASRIGLSHFNLGGRLGSTSDSLLRFKSSFSKNLIDFYILKLIVNRDIYRKSN